jgi:hypothetical protein
MQQWSKEFIENDYDIEYLKFRYAQSAYCFYAFNHHLLQPAAFEFCKLNLIQEKSLIEPLSLINVMCDDFGWCKDLPQRRPWEIFKWSITRIHDAAINDKLFKIYGGY